MTNENGTVQISNEVIAVIAKIATEEIEGVVKLTGNLGEVIRDSLKTKDSKTTGVKVETGKVEAALDIKICVEYGRDLRKIAQEVQKNVASNIEIMTGLKVVEVNVVVEDIKFPKTEKADPEEDVKKSRLA